MLSDHGTGNESESFSDVKALHMCLALQLRY